MNTFLFFPSPTLKTLTGVFDSLEREIQSDISFKICVVGCPITSLRELLIICSAAGLMSTILSFKSTTMIPSLMFSIMVSLAIGMISKNL